MFIFRIRALFGTNKTKNACHGSDSIENAQTEIQFFFPDVQPFKLPSDEQIQGYLDSQLYPILTKGLVELSKAKPENAPEWLGEWLLKNNPNKPKQTQ